MKSGGGRTGSVLVAQFADGPHVADREAALERIAAWTAELAPATAVGLHEVLESYPLAETILGGIVEASPYLFDLIRADGARFIRLLHCEPDSHLANLIRNGARAASDAESE